MSWRWLRLLTLVAAALLAACAASMSARLAESVGIDVFDDDIITGDRAHMRDAVAHLSSANHADHLDHQVFPLLLIMQVICVAAAPP